jgi:hypothetical protein
MRHRVVTTLFGAVSLRIRQYQYSTSFMVEKRSGGQAHQASLQRAL